MRIYMRIVMLNMIVVLILRILIVIGAMMTTLKMKVNVTRVTTGFTHPDLKKLTEARVRKVFILQIIIKMIIKI